MKSNNSQAFYKKLISESINEIFNLQKNVKKESFINYKISEIEKCFLTIKNYFYAIKIYNKLENNIDKNDEYLIYSIDYLTIKINSLMKKINLKSFIYCNIVFFNTEIKNILFLLEDLEYSLS